MNLAVKYEMQDMLKKWFKNATPIRCQAGTPIAAFIQAVEETDGELVLRCDCDMLFFDNGWLKIAQELLEEGAFDLIEPPRFGVTKNKQEISISTRAFLLRPSDFKKNCLPMKAHRLDFLRWIHRYIHSRPTYLPLEQMFTLEKIKGNLGHCILNNQLGYSLHIPT